MRVLKITDNNKNGLGAGIANLRPQLGYILECDEMLDIEEIEFQYIRKEEAVDDVKDALKYLFTKFSDVKRVKFENCTFNLCH